MIDQSRLGLTRIDQNVSLSLVIINRKIINQFSKLLSITTLTSDEERKKNCFSLAVKDVYYLLFYFRFIQK